MTDILFAYPGGRAGAALLLLRCSIILFLIATSAASIGAGWLQGAMLICTLPLAIGIASRWLAAICSFTIVAATWFWEVPFSSTLFLLMAFLNSLALALIGPGLYSIDALIFGRRTLRLSE